MTETVVCGGKSGSFKVPASKSWAHRLLITAALSDSECVMHCDGISKDIAATVSCLNSLGADIKLPGDALEDCIRIRPVQKKDGEVQLACGESGSTLRFLLPVAGALGANAVFHMEGRLSERPMEPLIEALIAHGMTIRREGELLYCSGALKAGEFILPGDISSQFISGLLMALPIVEGKSSIHITTRIESGDYLVMTEKAVVNAGGIVTKTENGYEITGGGGYKSPGELYVEKDWSSAAFPLCMGAFSSNGITVRGLNTDSIQGDREILNILRAFGASIDIEEIRPGSSIVTVGPGSLKGMVIDASRIPDLVPVISVLAAGADTETRIIHAERLRFKESDRLMTTATMLKSLGGEVEETEDGLLIKGKTRLSGGSVKSFNDHRIAMSAAVAAAICTGDVIIEGAECTEKSYPGFWDEIRKLEI